MTGRDDPTSPGPLAPGAPGPRGVTSASEAAWRSAWPATSEARTLRERYGLRPTCNMVIVLQAISVAVQPLDAYQIAERIAEAGHRLSLGGVYRAIRGLTKAGALIEFVQRDRRRFALPDTSKVVLVRTGAGETLILDAPALAAHILSEAGRLGLTTRGDAITISFA